MLYADQKTYLVELLMKQDQMSMACSIESRVPFLDHTLVEFAARIPDGSRSAAALQKYILKKAVEDLLPRDMIYRKKMGFPTPLRAVAAGCARRAALRRPCGRPMGCWRPISTCARSSALIDRHRSGFEDATDRIWRLHESATLGRPVPDRPSRGMVERPQRARGGVVGNLKIASVSLRRIHTIIAFWNRKK